MAKEVHREQEEKEEYRDKLEQEAAEVVDKEMEAEFLV
jgi:hypothetical protein